MGNGDVHEKIIYYEQQGGDRWTLGGAKRGGQENPRGTLKKEAAGSAGEEGLDPRDEIVGHPDGVERIVKDISIHIVETSTDIQKEGADLATRALEGADCVNQDSAGVEGGE